MTTMTFCSRKPYFANISRKLAWIVCILIFLFALKGLITGEKIYFLQFTYPLGNLHEVINELDTTGRTFVKPINNITKHYKVSKDPSAIFCNERTCKQYDMVFIVKSFIGNFGQRTAIRKTWAGVQNLNIKTIFVVGYQDDMEEYVNIESKLHNDILQFDMKDDYLNLVYKTIFSIVWLADLNFDSKYVHFLDDDRMVNTENLYDFAFTNLSPSEMRMIGYKVTFGTPFRSHSSKWRISIDDYPFDLWPPYLIGGTILTNMPVVQKIAKSFPYTKIINLEDTYIGIIAKLLNIKVEHNEGFLPFFKPGSELINKLSSPDYRSFGSLIEGWKQMHNK